MKDEIEQFYTEQKSSILSRLGTRIPREEAEDILHTVIVRSLQNLDSLSGVKDLTAWLWRSVYNGVIDHWRMKQRRRKAGIADAADPDLLDSVVDQKIRNEPEQLEKEELVKVLMEEIHKLPEEQRFVIIEQCINGQTFSALSKKTGVSIETLSARKRYAIERLRKSLHSKDYTL
ncbi:MAG: sigma-70 family RNA polymerase sigma factor [Spirochaetaceae bacterium]|jgi:RNA polymerase sigma factor (sigma-70 family)|nr:sigma-70 family RNA polymerase sigma factor [Spirochaetaceae bacterium]HPX27503.1 sigma-70 family RNA polymerase sigma factor [Treponemataceae bacterium]